MAITLALVDDDAAVRERVREVSARDPELTLLAAFNDARSAIDWLADHRVDVLLVDLGLPDMPGVEVIRHCARRHPGTDTMVLTVFDDPEKVLQCVEAGASGYLLKDTGDELASQIHQLRAGGAPMTPSIARRLLTRLRLPGEAGNVPPSAAGFKLTPAQDHVLQLVARGFRYAEIAQLSGVTVNTVHTHIRNIYGKLSVNSRSEAVFEASRLGLLDQVFPPPRPRG
jgi:DNA-binding NarL/FixJ family response regulator